MERKTQYLRVRLKPTFRLKLQQLADSQNRTLSNLVETELCKVLEKEGKGDKRLTT